MLKFRILCALLTFGVGSLSTIPFGGNLARRGAVELPQPPSGVISNTAQLKNDPYSYVVTTNGNEFAVMTGDTISFFVKIPFGRLVTSPPRCSAWCPNLNRNADVVYEIDLKHSHDGIPLYSAAVVRMNGSSFPPNTQILVHCPGVQQ